MMPADNGIAIKLDDTHVNVLLAANQLVDCHPAFLS